MANLKAFKFTKKSDLANSNNGWSVGVGEFISAMAGNDTIAGTGVEPIGIYNGGTINTGDGNDSITGTAGDSNFDNKTNGIFNSELSTINTGDGNDSINGTAGEGGRGIFNDGTINTGDGNDSITGTAGIGGISIFNGGTINTGDGNDSINANGIYNSGTINTGDGKDTVDALTLGFGDIGGTIDLGTGNDTLKGFGSGTFIGGDGTDKILFGNGIYTIDSVLGAITESGQPGGSMNVSSFEKIGGVNGGLFTFANGTLTVTNGVATFG
jgi:hypothetical protein